MKSLASARVVTEMRERMRQLTPEDRRLWGKMSVEQMLRHVSASYEVALGERTASAVQGPPRWLLKFAALRLPVQWPKETETTPELKRMLAEESAATFRELVNEAIGKMEAVARTARCEPSHPMFGKMSATDWKRWGYLHADHHLRQFGR